MRHLHVDIETFSSVDIKKGGLYKYVQAPDFQILLLAYSLDGSPVEVVDLAQGESLPEAVLTALFDPGVTKHAYNAAFEWYCLSRYFTLPDPAAWLSQWRCTMVHGLYLGYTAGLDVTGEVLGLPAEQLKSKTGAALIRTFSVPCKPTWANGFRTRVLPQHEPEKWRLFKEYCRQDVVTEMEIARRLAAFPMPDEEQRLWELDQSINARGVAVDMELVEGAIAVSEEVRRALMEEAARLTGLANPNSREQLLSWLQKELADGELDDLRKDTVKDLLAGGLDSDAARRVLEIRQELGKTSVKKYAAMKEAACADGRIRGLLQFYGANRTGRWAGRLVQVHNLPRNIDEALNATMEWARAAVKRRDTAALRFLYGSVPDALSQLVRTAFVPKPGHVFLVADFSAIEARVIAWLAGETWRQEVFATHGKIYEASASAMFGVPIDEIGKGSPLRQKGKVAELALGYQGGTGALVAMGALKMGLSEEELPEIVQRWRQANRRIVDLWYAVENAALEVMRTGQPAGVRGLVLAREGDIASGQDFLTVRLPSGRKLYYVRPFLAKNELGKESLHYWGVNEKNKWGQLSTYGGKLVENAVQAIARDCLAHALTKLTEAGFDVVFHVHDEVVIEAPDESQLARACEIMGQPIPWAPGLLLKAEGFATGWYRKE